MMRDESFSDVTEAVPDEIFEPQTIEAAAKMVEFYALQNGLTPKQLLAVFQAGRFAFQMAGAIPKDDKPPVVFHVRSTDA